MRGLDMLVPCNVFRCYSPPLSLLYLLSCTVHGRPGSTVGCLAHFLAALDFIFPASSMIAWQEWRLGYAEANFCANEASKSDGPDQRERQGQRSKSTL